MEQRDPDPEQLEPPAEATTGSNRAERRHGQFDEPDKDIITITQAAVRTGTHKDTLYRLARTGQFPPAIRIGSRWFVSVPRLQRFLHGTEAEA